MNLELNDKLCVLTGCFGGLGQAIGLTLLKEGARLIVADQAKREDGQVRAASVFGPRAEYKHCEATEPASIDALFADLDPDVLIVNAAVTHSHPLVELPLEEWRRVLEVNLTGSFLVARAGARRMQPRSRGSIVFIGSWLQDFPLVSTSAYSVSKAGIKLLMQNMALELAPCGIRVNTVAPGNFNAGMALRQMEREPSRRVSAEGRVALGRFGEAHELADAVAFIASERASYITGATLLVDGGNSLGRRA